MSIIRCQACGERLPISYEHAESRIRCRACGAAVQVPERGGAADVVPADAGRGPARSSAGKVLLLVGGLLLLLVAGGLVAVGIWYVTRDREEDFVTDQSDPWAEPALPADYRPKVTLPIPDGSLGAGDLRHPTASSSVVAMVNRDAKQLELWDINTGMRRHALSHDGASGGRISADGKYLARHNNRDGYEIWSFATSERLQVFGYKPAEFPALADFAAENEFVMDRQGNRFDSKIVQFFDIPTGRKTREFATIHWIYTKECALSADGKRLAVCSGHGFQIYDTTTGAPLAPPAKPPDWDAIQRPVEGLLFSPDGEQLAAAFVTGADQNLRILCWDVATGRLKLDHSPCFGLDRSYTGPPLQWTPDGKALLVSGRLLFEPERQKVLWLLRVPRHHSQPCRLLEGDHLGDHLLLPYEHKANEWKLTTLPVPRRRLDAALLAIDAKAPAHVRPGITVGLQIEIVSLLTHNRTEIENLLTDRLTERLKEDNLQVGANASVILHVRYRETHGSKVQFIEVDEFGNEIRRLGGPANRINMILEVGWKAAGSSDYLWRTYVARDSGFPEPLDHLWKQMSKRLVSLPYFIPQDASLPRLPLVSKLEGPGNG